MQNEENQNSVKLEKLNWLLWIAIGLLLITTVVYFSNFHGELSNDNAKWGTFGDFMGGTLNPIFALLSLLAIIHTIRIQTIELELSRQELADTREELRKSRIAQEKQKEAFDIQNQSVKLQTFENTFFNLFRHYNNLITEEMYQRLERINLISLNAAIPTQKFEEENREEIKTYFMTLYQLLKFVSSQENKFFGDDNFDAKFYSNLVRATMDDKMLCALLINCSIEAFKPYKLLVEQYNFFEHLSMKFIEKRGDGVALMDKVNKLIGLYDQKAFGKN